MIATVVLVELGSDFLIEPYLRPHIPSPLMREGFDLVEISIMCAVIWIVFDQLRRVEARVEKDHKELERLHAAARHWDAELEALHAAALRVVAEPSYQGLLQHVVEEAARLSQARYGALAELDPQGEVIRFVTTGVDKATLSVIGAPPTHRGLLKRLNGPGPVMIDDVTLDEAFTGFPRSHPHFRTFLGVPVRWEGELLGHLYLGGRAGETGFGPDQTRLLEMFALDAAVAIMRARRVKEQASLVRMAERQEIAMKLHDGVLQSLYAVGIQLDRARWSGANAVLTEPQVASALVAIRSAMDATRTMMNVLDDASRSATEQLRISIETMALLHEVTVTWMNLEIANGLPRRVVAELGPFITESFSNAVRHGHATHIRISFQQRSERICLTIGDNGRGLSDKLASGRGRGHLERRGQRLGGIVEWQRSNEGGVEVCLEFPVVQDRA